MTEVVWLFILAGGPMLIGLFIAYGMFNSRRRGDGVSPKRAADDL
jgi:hypothetical protein